MLLFQCWSLLWHLFWKASDSSLCSDFQQKVANKFLFAAATMMPFKNKQTSVLFYYSLLKYCCTHTYCKNVTINKKGIKHTGMVKEDFMYMCVCVSGVRSTGNWVYDMRSACKRWINVYAYVWDSERDTGLAPSTKYQLTKTKKKREKVHWTHSILSSACCILHPLGPVWHTQICAASPAFSLTHGLGSHQMTGQTHSVIGIFLSGINLSEFQTVFRMLSQNS